jgi:hypothetical protein
MRLCDRHPLNGDKIIMKIRGQLVDVLLEICPGACDRHVIVEGKQKIVHARMLKALCGMLVSSVLCHKKFRKDIEEIGFKVDPHDMCVASQMKDGEQQTVM